MLASEALGAPMIDSVPDQSSCGRYRAAVTAVDVGVNVLRKVEERKDAKQFQYSTGVDATVSQGLLAMSNLADGVVLFLSENGDVRQTPAQRGVLLAALQLAAPRERPRPHRHRGQGVQGGGQAGASTPTSTTPSSATASRGRTGSSRPPTPTSSRSRSGARTTSECFFAKFARELGVAKCQVVRLRPMCVCVAGVDGGKLRAALRSMKV